MVSNHALYSARVVRNGVKTNAQKRFILRSISMFGGSFSILHWIVVLAVVLLLFGGRGKVSAIMGSLEKKEKTF